MSIIIGLIAIMIGLWIAYEIQNAPLVDENENLVNKKSKNEKHDNK
jgi:hypothetical protein